MSKKQEIISIATEIIHSKGYQPTSISDILDASNIGKGQFYHYFASKYDLGLAVVEYIIQNMTNPLITNTLQSKDDPKSKINKMLDWVIAYHSGMQEKLGCPIGNLAIEMSEHDETFRSKIQHFLTRWIEAIDNSLAEMIEQNQLNSNVDTRKSAEAIASMVQGGILLMKNQKDIQILKNVVDMIRLQFNLS
ncbi:TetR/AcrR family transcriptional regulator [Paenibacillus filicis]|uniref:TetR/AcrR family transcriptional regulator n=1 Tax=Paenibacillus gyeongsangnamensis TaxID=3388067 RepID=A0ABT4Q441_9BACL|nr:TetR/AcrR family transcriptional regulator [Paenibacillus filicis]MCZ8511606.1 TetR/AcrR family transcriptional regulator [Paenibacillus filicis]